MAGSMQDDPFVRNIQLNAVTENRGFHSLNQGDEIQRPDIVEHYCQGLTLQARIDRIVHGKQSCNGKPATLIVFGFQFLGLNRERRFREVVVEITFKDAKGNGTDPVVYRLWPNGDFTLGEQTEIAVQNTSSRQVEAQIKGGHIVEGKGSATLKWEQKQSHKETDRSYLTGTMFLNMKIRKYGPKNAIRLTLSENSTTASGIVSDVRAALLLERDNNSDHFLASVECKAKANFSYNFLTGIRNVFGSSSPNDPVKFEPKKQPWQRPATLAPGFEAKLAEEVDVENLDKAELDRLAGVWWTTQLD